MKNYLIIGLKSLEVCWIKKKSILITDEFYFPTLISLKNKSTLWEILLWLSQFKNLTSLHDDVVLIPGLTQWVKDPGLPWDVVEGQQLQLQFTA